MRRKPTCFLTADITAQNESIFGLHNQANTYCDCLPNYDQDDSTERTEFSCRTHSTRDNPVELPHYNEHDGRQEINNTGCQRTAKPVPEVPLSIQIGAYRASLQTNIFVHHHPFPLSIRNYKWYKFSSFPLTKAELLLNFYRANIDISHYEREPFI